MARACKCDRCGKYFDWNTDYWAGPIDHESIKLSGVTNKYSDEISLDLCFDCYLELDKWFYKYIDEKNKKDLNEVKSNYTKEND